MVATGWTVFERQIREALCNNPDTSKALRL
jgi:hypothetical protein